MSTSEPYWPDPSKEVLEHLENELDLQKQDGSFESKAEGALEEKKSEETKTVSPEEKEQQIPTEKAVIPHNPRILIFTKDTSVTEEKSGAFKRMSGLKDVFQEVHVVVLDEKKGTDETQISRPFRNLWFYKTQSTSWWKQGYDAYKLAEEQMVFSGGFRADVIIAEDTYDSGLAALFISRKYELPFQLHIYDDFYDEAHLELTEHPALYGWASRYLLARVRSVRTKTEFQRQAVVEENKKLKEEVETLPSYYNLEAWRDAEPSFDLKEKYPQYKFIMLHISLMKRSSHSSEVLAGSAKILKRYPTVGLIMVGNGPLRSHLEKQVIELGIEKQVQFEPMPSEILSHLKSAHILLHLSEDSEEDEIILAAACVKLPMVAMSSGLAGKLFVDDESAQLCDATDLECITEGINRYLNENRERSSFAINAYDIVFEKIVQDYDAYIQAYKNSIERCLVSSQETE